MKRALLLLSLLSASTLALAARVSADEVDPWATLKTVRQSLVDAGPTGASFVQTYIPAGFSSGEKESGKLALALP
ncbi:MAG TPA: hypothetical protein VF173_35270, partial [Thermoanaerobaculia bacterium]|nr:hypothetical protein [Thermoanaerobaculia bacterium]